jgi:hypothetical protein
MEVWNSCGGVKDFVLKGLLVKREFCCCGGGGRYKLEEGVCEKEKGSTQGFVCF